MTSRQPWESFIVHVLPYVNIRPILMSSLIKDLETHCKVDLDTKPTSQGLTSPGLQPPAKRRRIETGMLGVVF